MQEVSKDAVHQTKDEATSVAQDVRGIEICTVEKTMERRTSCLQSNVDFLQKTINKLTSDHQQKLDASNRQIEALKNAVTRDEIYPVACGVATKNLATNRLLDALDSATAVGLGKENSGVRTAVVMSSPACA